jgi:peptidoglycan/LPS O-acetylase OafA/YrhL
VVIVPFAFLSYLIVEKPWMKLGDHWRVAIEKNHREKLKMQETAVTHQQTFTEQGTAPALPQEAITK